ncbi:MAG: helix-turn-helix transcriptional regulator [Deltaproteobacteria bacterium]|nr:helix-turn-helix transcriptional regulator [Deltaproteobacteria bacterium]
MVTAKSLRKEIGRRVREARVRLELTQAELAGRLDLEEPTIRAIEAGRRGLSLDSLVRLAEALGIQPGVLVDAGEPKPTSLGREAAKLVDGMSPAWQRAAVRILREIRQQQGK